LGRRRKEPDRLVGCADTGRGWVAVLNDRLTLRERWRRLKRDRWQWQGALALFRPRRTALGSGWRPSRIQ